MNWMEAISRISIIIKVIAIICTLTSLTPIVRNLMYDPNCDWETFIFMLAVPLLIGIILFLFAWVLDGAIKSKINIDVCDKKYGKIKDL
jgi:hypothetical protein